MENNNHSIRIPPIILAIIVIQVFFAVAFISTIVTQINQTNIISDRNNQPEVSMENRLLSNTNLSSEVIKDISLSLTEAIQLNTSNIDIAKSNATIRNNSLIVKEFKNYEFNALSFIVDIPNLEQSYQIFYKYPANLESNMPYYNNPRAVLCLEDETQIIYPNFDCHSNYPNNTRQHIVNDYFNFISFDDFKVNIDNQNFSQITIIPSSSSTETDNETYLSSVKSTITSLGISPDLFEYHLSN